MRARLEFTAVARLHAEQRGILRVTDDFVPPLELMRGDVVEFAAANGPVRFVVRSRRLCVAADGARSFAFTLDYPARRS